jgi:hypothetical protein
MLQPAQRARPAKPVRRHAARAAIGHWLAASTPTEKRTNFFFQIAIASISDVKVMRARVPHRPRNAGCFERPVAAPLPNSAMWPKDN